MVLVENLELQLSGRRSLSTQIQQGIRCAIADGSLRPGSRLPSWNDLAAQLGVSRNTVRAAYQQLSDERLLQPAGSAGTRVVPTPPLARSRILNDDCRPVGDLVPSYSDIPKPLRM